MTDDTEPLERLPLPLTGWVGKDCWRARLGTWGCSRDVQVPGAAGSWLCGGTKPFLITSGLEAQLPQAWGTHAEELGAAHWALGVNSEGFGILALRTSCRNEAFSPWAWGPSGVETGVCTARSHMGRSGWKECWAPE